MQFSPDAPWFHGSPYDIDLLRAGSTITQWRALAEAFSHKPATLCIDDDGVITHDGTAFGVLYRIAEPIAAGTDVIPHPRTTMDENLEWLTTRPLRLERICAIGVPSSEEAARMKAALDALRLQL